MKLLRRQTTFWKKNQKSHKVKYKLPKARLGQMSEKFQNNKIKYGRVEYKNGIFEVKNYKQQNILYETTKPKFSNSM